MLLHQLYEAKDTNPGAVTLLSPPTNPDSRHRTLRRGRPLDCGLQYKNILLDRKNAHLWLLTSPAEDGKWQLIYSTTEEVYHERRGSAVSSSRLTH